MSNLTKILCAVLLIAVVVAFGYGDLFSIFWSKEKKLAESAKLLQLRFANQAPFENSGWSLRNIYVAEGQLFVVVDFPAKDKERACSAPIYTELVRYCPVLNQDGYWNKSYAQPFTIYLSNAGKNSARALARCTRALDKPRYDRIIMTGSVSGPKPTVVPKEGEDLQRLESAAASGHPSLKQAIGAMHFDKSRELQICLDERPELVELYDGSGHTLLFYATTPQEVKILIGYGADPNVRCRNGPTVLGWATERGGSYKMVKALIEAGADAGQVAPEYAATGRLAELLLENGARISNDSLYIAISSGADLGVADVLYAHGARLDKTTYVASPLHYLIDQVKDNYSGDLEKELKRFGAAIRFCANRDKRMDGATALEYVQRQTAWDGRDEIIAMLQGEAEGCR